MAYPVGGCFTPHMITVNSGEVLLIVSVFSFEWLLY